LAVDGVADLRRCRRVRRTILGDPAGGGINVTSARLNLDAICCMTSVSAARAQLEANNRSVKETSDDPDPVR
jgi:hypothetical protein